MTLNFNCPNCGQATEVPEEAINRRARCNSCDSTYVVRDVVIQAKGHSVKWRKRNVCGSPPISDSDKNWLLGAGCFLVLGILLFIVLSNSLLSSLDNNDAGASNNNSGGRHSDFDIKYTGRNLLKKTLRDPDSLQIIEERVLRPGLNGSAFGYYAKYRAKNGFGGYVVNEYYVD